VRIRYRSTASDPGQASLEFALVLPLVIVIVAATVWIGAVMRVQMAIDHLAYRAARAAATATSRDELHVLAADALTGASHDALRHEVQIDDELVTVVVSRAVPAPPLVARFVADHVLTARATFRLEYVLDEDG
jgi:hypothetical protein